MRNEERVLRLAFPEYDAYAQRTARVIPGVF
jgi:protein-S-isoprenylcysteine O-methyltransferase Ste14